MFHFEQQMFDPGEIYELDGGRVTMKKITRFMAFLGLYRKGSIRPCRIGAGFFALCCIERGFSIGNLILGRLQRGR